MIASTCNAALLLERWNLIAIERETVMDDRDVVHVRKSSHKSKRQSKKLESSLNEELGLESLTCNTSLVDNAVNPMELEASSASLLARWNLIGGESWSLMDDRAADVVYLRESSRNGARQSKTLESVLLDDQFDVGKTPSLSLKTTVTSEKSAEDGNGPGIDDDYCGGLSYRSLSDTFSDVSTRRSSFNLGS